MFFINKKMALLWLKRTARVIWKGLLWLQRVSLVVLALFTGGLITAEVVFRYFLEIPGLWVEELCTYVILWLYLLGASYATYERSYIRAGIMQMFFKDNPKVLSGFQVGAAFISLGVSCLLAIWSYNNFIWVLTVDPRTVVLFLPLAYARLGLVCGFTLMALYFLAELIDSVRGGFMYSAPGVNKC